MADTLKVPSQLDTVSVQIPLLVDAVHLNSGSEATWTVPSNTEWILLSGTGGFYVRNGATAAAPSGAVTDGTGSLYIPSSSQFKVNPGDVIHFVRSAASTTIVTIGRYS